MRDREISLFTIVYISFPFAFSPWLPFRSRFPLKIPSCPDLLSTQLSFPPSSPSRFYSFPLTSLSRFDFLLPISPSRSPHPLLLLPTHFCHSHLFPTHLLLLSRSDTALASLRSSWVPETLAAAQAAEARMQAQDDAIRAVGDARNALEAFILSARGARDGPHGKLLHEDATRTALAEAEDWLYSDEAEAAVTPTVYVERLAALETCLRELNSDYYAALDADAVEKAEREAADRARWEAEAANQCVLLFLSWLCFLGIIGEM